MTSEIKIETFDVNIGTSGSTHTLSNNVGATSKAFIRVNSSTDKSSAGPTGSTGNTGPNIAHMGVQLTGTTTITFTKNTSTEVKMIGEVWRYTGASGGANEFIVRGHYAVTISGTSATQSVSGISNRNDCVPIITGVVTSETSTSDYEQCTFAAHINSSGDLVVSRNNSGTSADVYVSVVEFTGSNWSVGHGISSSHDTATETVTLNTDSTGSSGSTFDVDDWENAWIEGSMEGDSSETGLADVMALIYPHTDTDKVYFSVTDADGNAKNDGDGYIHVITHEALRVYRNHDSNVSEGNGSYGTVLWPSDAPTDADIDELALEWFVSTSGTGTAHARGRLNARITNASGTIQHWVHRSGNTVQARYGVIHLAGLTVCGISSMEDDHIAIGETDNVIDGWGFESSQGTGEVELASSSDYSTATKVTQTIDSWSDTSIQFDSVQGSLTPGQLVYLFVTNDSGDRNSAYPVWLGIRITDMEDEQIDLGETDNVITGNDFGSTQGTGKVELCENDDYTGTKVIQTIDSWSDISIQFDAVQGSLDDGINYLFVTNNSGHRNQIGYGVNVGEQEYHLTLQELHPDHLWMFDNTYDDTGDESNRPANNAQDGDPSFVTTKICKGNTYSLFLDGDDSTSPANSTFMNDGSQTRRVMGGWFMIDNIQTQLACIYEEGAQINNYCFILGIGNTILCQAVDDGGYNIQVYGDRKIAPNRPYHICWEFSGNGYQNIFRFYIDGVAQSRSYGNPPNLATFPSHTGNIEFGGTGTTLEVGGTDITFAHINRGYYAAWATWEEAAVISGTQIKEKLFEAGALPDNNISRDTESAMQSAIEAFDDTTHPDWPLTYRISVPTDTDNPTFTLTNQVFDAKISCHLRWMGSGTITIRNSGTSNLSVSKISVPNAGTVSIIETALVELVAKDIETKSNITGVRVLLLADTGGPLPANDSVTITRAGSVATVSHTSHGLLSGQSVKIIGAEQKDYNGIHEITVTSSNAYTYTVSGSPDTPATGTITSTAVILHDVTDSNGKVASEIDYTSTQPVVGYARKATSSPYYRQSDVITSIPEDGLYETVLLIPDE